MRLECRQIVSPQAVELYLSAVPGSLAGAPGEAGQMFAAIQEEAARRGARLCRQRVFVPDGCEDAYRRAWESAGQGPGDLWCNWLRAGPGTPGGVQAHAVAGPAPWTPLVDAAGATAGWACRNGRSRWAVIGGLSLPRTGDDAATARQAFEAAERLLAQADLTLCDVARTWFFLDDILAWYGQFNEGRSGLFRRRGLLSPARGDGPDVPASTGIGVSPAGGRWSAGEASGAGERAPRLAMELVAVGREEGCIVRRPAAGKQRCACEYGSAFARAADAATPAGRTLFVSGTAAIDEEGRTCFPGDADGQIRMTLRNVQAVLSDMGRGAEDVVEAVAYCKTPAIAARFAEAFRASLPWPWVTAVCDVCRHDLLFEVEATAGRPG
jgi:enamine deaminase RidA (YjgF/YER057c/UK114 family)